MRCGAAKVASLGPPLPPSPTPGFARAGWFQGSWMFVPGRTHWHCQGLLAKRADCDAAVRRLGLARGRSHPFFREQEDPRYTLRPHLIPRDAASREESGPHLVAAGSLQTGAVLGAGRSHWGPQGPSECWHLSIRELAGEGGLTSSEQNRGLQMRLMDREGGLQLTSTFI